MKIDNPKAQELIHNLFTLTEKGKLNWQESADEDSFYVAFRTYSVILSIRGIDYSIDVVNSLGSIVESILVRFIDKAEPTLFHETEELYKLARSKGLKTDAIMTELLESLNEML